MECMIDMFSFFGDQQIDRETKKASSRESFFEKSVGHEVSKKHVEM